MSFIFTSHSMFCIDLILLRYSTISPIIRWVDPDLIPQERKEWKSEIQYGQYQLMKVCKDERFRDYFWSAKDKVLVKSNYPQFLASEKNPLKKDLMSRPMRYHTVEEKEILLGIIKPPRKKTAKRKMKEDES